MMVLPFMWTLNIPNFVSSSSSISHKSSSKSFCSARATCNCSFAALDCCVAKAMDKLNAPEWEHQIEIIF